MKIKTMNATLKEYPHEDKLINIMLFYLVRNSLSSTNLPENKDRQNEIKFLIKLSPYDQNFLLLFLTLPRKIFRTNFLYFKNKIFRAFSFLFAFYKNKKSSFKAIGIIY